MKAIEYVDIHFDDLDLMGIVHNARYAVLVERAVAAYWIRLGFPFDSSKGLLAVAEFTINYRLPINRLGPIGVEFWIDRLGTSSAVYGYRVISPDDTVHADGKRVMINLDPVTRRPAPWPVDTRAVAEGLAIEEPAHQG
jgi:acyl-CoA thioester hydrolase